MGSPTISAFTEPPQGHGGIADAPRCKGGRFPGGDENSIENAAAASGSLRILVA